MTPSYLLIDTLDDDEGTELIEYEGEILNSANIAGSSYGNGIGTWDGGGTGPFDLEKFFPLSSNNSWERTITELEFEEFAD